MKKSLLIVAIASMFAYANSEVAKKSVEIELHSYQKSVVVDKNGKKSTKWVKPTKVVPGTIIKYVSIVKNHTDNILEKAEITSKIDKNLIFIPNSIDSKLKYRVEFSIDGKTYADAKDLKVIGKDGKKHLAEPKDYRALKFELLNLPAKANSSISYQAKVK